MKKLIFLFVLGALALGVPAMAQGAFNDVPVDHWAYDAVDELQQSGVLIGYPDGTFAGKRTITRYEFAVALARVLSMIPEEFTGPDPVDLSDYVKKGEIEMPDLSDYAKKSDIPSVANFATRENVARVERLVDEFRDELAAIGVDVDAVKRDVAALDARVTLLEDMVKKIRWSGNANMIALSGKNNYGGGTAVVDLDNRQIPNGVNLLEDITVVRDFDLNVVGRVNDYTTANATINYGNYLNYLGAVDDYVGGVRPTDRTGLADEFFPYYMYIDSAFMGGEVQVGRLPLQFTPYTLKKVDVDSYTSILKTDSGNYPVDGIKAAYNVFGVDLTLFAAKHDTNDFLANGLTGQTSSGLGSLHTLGGVAVAGLNGLLTQSAGARLQFGVPFGGNMGVTYYQAYSEAAGVASNYDQARVYGADLSVLLMDRFNLVGSYTESETLAEDGAAVADIDDDNVAWDAKIATGFGKLGFAAGYKSIDRNFAAAGSWGKIGRWANPVNVEGPYADISYPLNSKMKLVVNGEYLNWKDTLVVGGFGQEDDTILRAEAGLKWGLSANNSLALGYEYIQWAPDNDALEEATETYLTVGWAHQMGANAGLNVGYQFINYDQGNNGVGPYGANYRGGLGVVQFGVSF